mmetsp:Transcript_129137/g.325845  ORF Transcript_129137/g.325845 Transcript_129137/m.325845 type:complete len:637 (-) Transcript_129137:57-1967(-)
MLFARAATALEEAAQSEREAAEATAMEADRSDVEAIRTHDRDEPSWVPGFIFRQNSLVKSAEEARRSWSRTRHVIHAMLTHFFAEAIIGGTIGLNLVLVVLETNYAADEETDVPEWVTNLNMSVTFVFFTELGMRLYVERKKFLRDYMNLFDFVVVFADTSSTILRLALDWEAGWPLEVFRLARVVKILRAMRLMILFPELALMLRSLLYAVKAIIWAVLMIFVCLGMWSILAVMIIHPLNRKITKTGYWESTGCERCPYAFSSVQQSMLTFAQHIVAGDSWSLPTMPIIEHYPASALFFFLVLVSISMAVMNLILAVIVEKAAEAREMTIKEEAINKEKAWIRASQDLLSICKDLDTDCSGSLSFEEVVHGFRSNAAFADIMKTMDIVEADLEVVFHMLDTDGSRSVDYKEFVNQLHMMKSCEAHTLIVFIKFYVMELRQKLVKVLEHVPRTSFANGGGHPPRQQLQETMHSKDVGHEVMGPTDEHSTADGEPRPLQLLDNIRLLDVHQEVSDLLRREGEACRARIKHLEDLVSSMGTADESRTHPASARRGGGPLSGIVSAEGAPIRGKDADPGSKADRASHGGRAGAEAPEDSALPGGLQQKTVPSDSRGRPKASTLQVGPGSKMADARSRQG